MSHPATYPFRGQNLTLAEIAIAAGMQPTHKNLNRLRDRIVRRGWSAERAVTEPPMPRSACGRLSAADPLCRFALIPRGM